MPPDQPGQWICVVYEEKNSGTEYQACPVLCFCKELRVGEEEYIVIVHILAVMEPIV